MTKQAALQIAKSCLEFQLKFGNAELVAKCEAVIADLESDLNK